MRVETHFWAHVITHHRLNGDPYLFCETQQQFCLPALTLHYDLKDLMPRFKLVASNRKVEGAILWEGDTYPRGEFGSKVWRAFGWDRNAIRTRRVWWWAEVEV